MSMKRGRPKGKSTDNKSYGPLGDLIRKKRIERGFGLRDVAKAADVSVQFISNIEHGRAPLPWERAEKVSSVLGIPMEELQAVNLSIRADYKSFVRTSRGKKVAKSNTALGSAQELASAVAVASQDAQLKEMIRLVQSVPVANRKKFYAEAKKLIETL